MRLEETVFRITLNESSEIVKSAVREREEQKQLKMDEMSGTVSASRERIKCAQVCGIKKTKVQIFYFHLFSNSIKRLRVTRVTCTVRERGGEAAQMHTQ